jgi:hypothetical protein
MVISAFSALNLKKGYPSDDECGCDCRPPTPPCRPKLPDFECRPPTPPCRPKLPDYDCRLPTPPCRPKLPHCECRPPTPPCRPKLPDCDYQCRPVCPVKPDCGC